MVSQGIVKLIRFTTNILLGVSQGECEFHMMLLKSHFKLKFSQHFSQDRILYHFCTRKIFLFHRMFHMVNSVHMVFTCCSHAFHRACPSSECPIENHIIIMT